MNRAIVTYADGPHEELLEVALPTYSRFASLHNYDLIVGKKLTELPPAWNKIPLLLDALNNYGEVVWFDCDMIVVNPTEDFPPIREQPFHSMVRHFEHDSEVPNSGVWRIKKEVIPLLHKIMELEVFENHGWWEQAALMTLMGYCVPPQGHHFPDTRCRCVRPTKWYTSCQFMRLKYNSHPNYRAENPVIVHCSYPDMEQRLEVMRSLVKDPHYDYPRYDKPVDDNEEKEQC